jgi:hypothetical protein
VAHRPQNFMPSGLSKPQLEHCIAALPPGTGVWWPGRLRRRPVGYTGSIVDPPAAGDKGDGDGSRRATPPPECARLPCYEDTRAYRPSWAVRGCLRGAGRKRPRLAAASKPQLWRPLRGGVQARQPMRRDRWLDAAHAAGGTLTDAGG